MPSLIDWRHWRPAPGFLDFPCEELAKVFQLYIRDIAHEFIAQNVGKFRAPT